LLSSAQAATRDILLLGPAMLTGLWGMGRDNFILKAIFGPAAIAWLSVLRNDASLQKFEV
jgi:hypothetical protein